MHLYMSGTPSNDHYQVIENQMCTHRLFSMHGNYVGQVMKWLDLVKSGVRTFDDYCDRKTGLVRQLEHQDKVMRRMLSDHGDKEEWAPYAETLRMVSAQQGPRYPRHIMLDSGAFTAWNAGKAATLDDVKRAYSSFLSKADGLFEEVWLINLDVIPGESGRSATADELQSAIAGSDSNLLALRSEFGDRVLPVFHQDESKTRLLETIDQARGYLCLSPRNDRAEQLRWSWAHLVRNALIDLSCNVRTHGLATTGNEMIRNADLYSGDSEAWKRHSRYGVVDLVRRNTVFERRLPPDLREARPEDENPSTSGFEGEPISIHEHGSLQFNGYHIARDRNDLDRNTGDELIDNARHYLTLPAVEQLWVRDRVSETVPFMLAQYDVRARALVNIAQLQSFAESFHWTCRPGRTLINGVDAEVGSPLYHEVRPFPTTDDRDWFLSMTPIDPLSNEFRKLLRSVAAKDSA